MSAGKISSPSTTLNELLARWLDQIEDRLSPTTTREYRRLVTKRIGPDLGRTRLGKLSTQRLDAYYAALVRERGLSPASVRHVHAVLRGSLGQAVKWGWIPVNPAVSASPPKIRRKEINPPSLADTRKLLLTADEYDVEFAALLRVLTATRLGAPSVIHRIGELDGDGLARTSMTDLEIGFSARNAAEHDQLLEALGAFRGIDVEPHHFARARSVQRQLADKGLTGRKIPDLLIAAVAESESLTVLHYDADFDHIQFVTQQPAEWIVQRGSID